MLSPFRRFLRCFVLPGFILLPLVLEASLFGTRWPDLTEAEQTLRSPKIDPEAGAEILLREVHIDDSKSDGTTYRYFVRIKVFDQRGVEALKTIELDTLDGARVSRVNARVLHPDGRIEEVEKDAIHKRNIWRVGREKADRTAFALPGLSPGCIVDYRYNIWEDGSAYGYRLLAYAGYPTHELRFRVRFYPGARASWTWQGFDGSPFEKPVGGVHQLILHDLPAAPDEDFLPPPDKVQPWITIYYVTDTGDDWTEKYWERRAQWLDREARKLFKPKDRAVRAKATELVEGIEDDRERLQRLYAFCQQEIRNLNSPGAFTAAERDVIKSPRNGADVLKHGYGSSYHINALFASMAGALDYEVTLAACSDRRYSTFNTNMAYYRAMPHPLVAIRLPGHAEWSFYAPGSGQLAFGQLSWRHERTAALIGNRKGELLFVRTPGLASRDTVMSRRALLNLNAEGQLEGEVTMEHSGHFSSLLRAALDEAAGSVETFFEELLEDPFPNATISNVRVEHADDSSKPLRVQLHLLASAYADRTSSRLFFEPAVFRKGSERLFEESERAFPIVFPFHFEEEDDVRIVLPENFVPEEASAPVSVVESETLAHVIWMGYSPERNLIAYKRSFRLDLDGIGKEGYPAVRELFRAIHEQDNHLLTLRREEAPELPVMEAEASEREKGTVEANRLPEAGGDAI